MRVGVIGAGAIGAVVASAARKSGHNVTLCVRTPLAGLRVETAEGVEKVEAEVVTDPSVVEAGADVVFLAVKANDTPTAESWLRAFGAVPVVAVQNGLGHAARLAPFVAAGSKVVPGLAYIAAERLSPGRVRRYRGDLLVVPAAWEDLVGRAVSGGLKVRGTDDIVGACWQKLLGNLIANPLTALTMRRIDVTAEPAVAELARAILREAVAVGRAEGADLSDELVDLMVEGTGRYGSDVGSSMLYDRLAGRPLEHQFITGEVVRRAARHGIPVPVNTTILTLLDALSGGAGPGGVSPPTGDGPREPGPA